MTRVFVKQPNGSFHPLQEQAYDSEDLLQRLLAEHPDLLAGDQMPGDTPRRWLLIDREAGIPDGAGSANRWSVDHLFVDQDGVPTLVEVKRRGDTRIRREVVGQMLDYAANAIAYWPADVIRAKFEANCEAYGMDPGAGIASLVSCDADSTDEIDAYWGQVKTNLQAGKIRLVFVADEIPASLGRIVEFLNEQMDPAEVLAVEVRQFVGGELQTLVPRVVGQTAAARQRKSTRGPREQWTEARFMEALREQASEEDVPTATSLLRWVEDRFTRISWGRGGELGSFVAVHQRPGSVAQSEYKFFAVWTYGTVELYFQYLRNRPPFDSDELRHQLMEQLNEIPGVNLTPEALSKYPNLPIRVLSDSESMTRFQEIMEWAIAATDHPAR